VSGKTGVMNVNPWGYSDAVWRLFQQAPRAGNLTDGAVITGRASTPASKAVLALHVRLDGQGRVADARFQAYGCPTTIAVGAYLADRAVGRRLAELAELKSVKIRQDLEIPDERAHCALLGEDAIRALLAAAGSEKSPWLSN